MYWNCLPLLRDTWSSICIGIVCHYFVIYEAVCVLELFASNIITFEINVIFLIKPLFYIIKKLRKQFKYLENKRSFSGEIKCIFHHFYRGFSLQRLSQTWECVGVVCKLKVNEGVNKLVRRKNIFESTNSFVGMSVSWRGKCKPCTVATFAFVFILNQSERPAWK